MITGLASLRNVGVRLWNSAPINQVGTWFPLFNSVEYDNACVYNSTNADQDTLYYWADVEVGSYVISVAGLGFANAAVLTLGVSQDNGTTYLDVANFDFYAPTSAAFQFNVSGVAIGVTQPIVLRLRCNGKNPSSGGNTLELSDLNLTKTSFP